VVGVVWLWLWRMEKNKKERKEKWTPSEKRDNGGDPQNPAKAANEVPNNLAAQKRDEEEGRGKRMRIAPFERS